MTIDHVEIPGDPRIGMKHQALADQTAGIGEAVREPGRGGIQ
jgi:hypothetical protein